MDVVTYRHTNPSMLARKNHITTAIASGAVHRNQPVHIVMKKASTANFSASHYNYTPHSHARAQTARSIHTAQSQGVHMPAPFESSYSSTDHGNHRVMGMELGRYMVSSVVDPRPPMGYKHKPKYTVDADFHTTALERREEYITQLERRKRLMKVPKAARLAVEEAMAEEDERKLVEQQRAHQSRLQRREVNRQKKDIHHTLLNPQRRVRDRRENGRDGKYSSTHSVSGAPSPPRASLSIRLTPSLPPIHNRNNNTNDKDSEEENGARGFPSSSGATRTITAKIRRSTHNASKIDRTMDGRKTDDEGEKGAEKTGEGEREGEEEEEERQERADRRGRGHAAHRDCLRARGYQ